METAGIAGDRVRREVGGNRREQIARTGHDDSDGHDRARHHPSSGHVNSSDSPDGATRIQRTLTWVIFLAGAGAIAYLCLSILRPFAGVIAWSGVLAIICY